MSIFTFSSKAVGNIKSNLISRMKSSYLLNKHSEVMTVSYKKLIESNTVVSTDHLTPELKLRLITPECEAWNYKTEESPFPSDPFWGIYWPGGQALGRYILDNEELFHQKNVMDIGSGSGACALAAAKCGAQLVLANDIDPVSLDAISMNAQLNDLSVHTYGFNLIGEQIDSLTVNLFNQTLSVSWDIVLIGDLFYDSEFSRKLFVWLCDLSKKGKDVYVGDPGRHGVKEIAEMSDVGILKKIEEFDFRNLGHNGFSSCAVYKIQTGL